MKNLSQVLLNLVFRNMILGVIAKWIGVYKEEKGELSLNIK